MQSLVGYNTASNFGHVLSNGPLYDVGVIVAICPQQRRYEIAHASTYYYTDVYTVWEVLTHVGNAVTVSLDG